MQVSSLRKSFAHGSGRTDVLCSLDLEVDAGEIIAIKGRSGSGKTSLLNILGGLDRDFRGTVRVASHDLDTMVDRALSLFRNEVIGFVFQSFHLIDSMTCSENVALPAAYSRRRGHSITPRNVEKVLERVGLSGLGEEETRTMSGGQKQRAAIGRAILLGPRVLLCDEPTGNLDVETGAQILKLFQDLNASEGMTVVLVTHEDRVARIAGRVLNLEGGVLV
ncbi:MAG: ABC transporter ATP-binding protein [Deltaproteobacteria bacterium]|nr:ABC transporter ATP-binding protein [Deltaproteobacteria bacterium]